MLSEKKKNHDSYSSIDDGHDSKIKGRCYEAVMTLNRGIKCLKRGNQANNIYKM